LKKTILLVDDDPHILDIYTYQLPASDFSLLMANCGQQALSILQQQQVDLLVADLSMPNGDGHWLVAHLPYPVKTILVSGILFEEPPSIPGVYSTMTKDDFINQSQRLLAQNSKLWA
jgi:CheY-like chemotaxis protein